MTYSVIVPVYNEEKNVAKLHQEIKTALKKLRGRGEIIFIDDGSTDGTFKALKRLRPIKIIKLRRNTGQSAALDAGIKESKGKIIITMDGDGQNDPNDIPKLVRELKNGYDFVCGWRFKRKDPLLKKVVSRGAEFLRKFLVNDEIHDAGCTLRSYKRECFENLELYGEMHRMIPALLRWRGFKIGEVKVNHRPRRYGKSKYNWKRIVKGLLDMVYVWFWRKFSTRPLHLFGGLGLIFMFIGGGLTAFLAYLRFFKAYTLSDKIWPLVAFIFVVIGVQLLITGLISAYMVETGKTKKYFVETVKKRI